MELVMKYRAKDGATFDSINECRAHEAELVKNDYVMLDRDGNKTEDPDEAMGVYIADEKSAKALLKRFRLVGSPYEGLDEDSIGAYYWNDMLDRYEYFDETQISVIVGLVNTVYERRANERN